MKGRRKMTIAVRYYSRTGNTKKLAEAVADKLGVKAKPVSVPLNDPVDKLVLCNSVYYASADKHVKNFVKENAAKIGELLNVSSAAIVESSYDSVKSVADEAGVKMSAAEFHCLGKSDVSNAGHPNAEDLRNVRAFASSIA